VNHLGCDRLKGVEHGYPSIILDNTGLVGGLPETIVADYAHQTLSAGGNGAEFWDRL
jgi:hypothetical protein